MSDFETVIRDEVHLGAQLLIYEPQDEDSVISGFL